MWLEIAIWLSLAGILYWVITKARKETKKINEPEVVIVDKRPSEVINPCAYCGGSIMAHEQSRKFDKKRYHIKCLRKLKKEARKAVLG